MLSFSRASNGTITVTDTSDGSIATISNKTSEVLISADFKTNTIEIRSSGFYKAFNSYSVQTINNSIPANKSPETIIALLNNAIFIPTQTTTSQLSASQASTSIISITLTAGQNISVGQVVTIGLDGKAYIYDISNENHALLITGIAIQSAVISGSISIVTEGIATVPGMNWLPGIAYFVGINGFPNDQVPSAPNILRSIGTGLSSNSIKLSAGMSVITQ